MRSRGPLLLGMLLLVVAVGGAMALAVFEPRPDERPVDPDTQVLADKISPSSVVVPSDDPVRGVVLDGLRPGTAGGPCEGLYELDVSGLPAMCTHGPDPAPDGIDVTVIPALQPLDDGAEEVFLPVIDDGISGERVQAVYAVAADRPGRYREAAPLIERWAIELDRMYALSGGDGERHIRFVTNPDGSLNVAVAVLSRTGDDSIGYTIRDLRALGYDDPARKYLVWMDAAVYCGIAQVHPAGRPAPEGGDGLSMYARVDAACWGHPAAVEARQLALTLGATRSSDAVDEPVVWDLPESGFLHAGESEEAKPEPESTVDNRPPGVNAGQDQAVSLPDPVALKGRVSDDGLPDGTLDIAWSKVSGPGTVTFEDATVVETEASFSAAGSYVLRLVADDGELAAGDTVTVTVGEEGEPPPPPPANQAPLVDAGADLTVIRPNSASLDGTVSDDGLPGGTLVTTWSVVSGRGTVTFGDPAAVDTTASFSASGSYVLRLVADDGELATTDTVTVTVRNADDPPPPPPPPPPPGNAAPVVDAGADVTVTLPDQASLDGTVSDDGLPDGTLTTTWSMVSGPGTVTFGDATAVDTTASFSVAGTYVLELAADDGALVSTDTVTVTVEDPPSGPTEVTETFDSSLNNGHPTRSFPVTTADGPFTAVLTVEARGGPAPELTLEVFDPSGSLYDSATGPTPVVVTGTMTSGTWTFVVSGPYPAWFVLEVTHYQ